jgi:hypothetical protein
MPATRFLITDAQSFDDLSESFLSSEPGGELNKASISELDGQGLFLFSSRKDAIAKGFGDDRMSSIVERTIYQIVCMIKR